ncbi:MAG: undecaprenyl-diphosphate phosphatase [Candidatus Micrarchaeia archaeon]
MAVDFFQAVFLGAIQGITEWLPISSSGHLVLAQEFFGLEASLFFDLMLHFGTLLAVLVFFRKDFLEMFKAALRFDFSSEYGRLVLFLILGSIPVALAGFFLHDFFESLFSSVFAVGVALIVTGTFLFLTKDSTGKKNVSFKGALLMGLAQAFAIVPGISRSGLTIGTGLLLGMRREKAARFSFFLAFPAILGATLFEAKNAVFFQEDLAFVLAGTVSAFAVGFLSIGFLLDVVKKRSFHVFAYYTWLIGLFALFLSFLNGKLFY